MYVTFFSLNPKNDSNGMCRFSLTALFLLTLTFKKLKKEF